MAASHCLLTPLIVYMKKFPYNNRVWKRNFRFLREISNGSVFLQIFYIKATIVSNMYNKTKYLKKKIPCWEQELKADFCGFAKICFYFLFWKKVRKRFSIYILWTFISCNVELFLELFAKAACLDDVHKKENCRAKEIPLYFLPKYCNSELSGNVAFSSKLIISRGGVDL